VSEAGRAALYVHGAAREVTGSRTLLDTGRSRVLIECGIVQGDRDADERNREKFPFDPARLDAVVLSHVHLDHSGLLPRLVAEGYRGPIHCTPASAELLPIMLRDAASLQARDVEWENKWRQRAGRPLLRPMYGADDVERLLDRLNTTPYGREVRIAADVGLCFRDAGHILGSAIVELGVDVGGGTRRVVYSGDLGFRDSVLMREPDTIEQADVVFMEGTYGGRDHRRREETLAEFEAVLAQAHEDGGNVLIPSFAVGRTQELLYYLALLHHRGRLKQTQVFLDSPMAVAVTAVYARNMKDLDADDLRELATASKGHDDLGLPILKITRTPQESMRINRVTGGAVIIAGSGMCEGGRIRHHLKYNLWRRDAHVVIVGFQARGTLGRRLIDGADSVRILGQDIAVNARVHSIGGFSAHAGQRELLQWARGFRSNPRFYLMHGEDEALDALRQALEAAGIQAQVPGPGERIDLD